MNRALWWAFGAVCGGALGVVAGSIGTYSETMGELAIVMAREVGADPATLERGPVKACEAWAWSYRAQKVGGGGVVDAAGQPDPRFPFVQLCVPSPLAFR